MAACATGSAVARYAQAVPAEPKHQTRRRGSAAFQLLTGSTGDYLRIARDKSGHVARDKSGHGGLGSNTCRRRLNAVDCHRMSAAEEPDSPPRLSAATAALLEEFLSENANRQRTENASVEFAEDWNLSQVRALPPPFDPALASLGTACAVGRPLSSGAYCDAAGSVRVVMVSCPCLLTAMNGSSCGHCRRR